jgi:hypothetical protein
MPFSVKFGARALDAALETIMRRVLWIALLLFAARFGISQ